MLIIFTLAFVLNCIISCQEVFCVVSHVLPSLLWIHLIYLVMFSVLIDIGRVMILFVCILHSKAKS